MRMLAISWSQPSLRRRWPATVGGIAAAGILAACGGSGTGGSGTQAAASRSVTAQTSPSAVGVGHTPLGQVLVDARGRTLYMLTADPPGASVCTGACQAVWPPLTVAGTAAPAAGSGVTASLSTIALASGQRQVSANGHALYTYVDDPAAGIASGQDITSFGGTWYVLDATGRPEAAPAPTVNTPPASGGGSGGGLYGGY